MKRPILIVALIYIGLIILFRPIIDKPIKPFNDKKLNLVGIIDSEPVFREKTVSFYLKIIKGAGGKVRASLPKSDLLYGDKIKVSGILSYIEAPKNPGLPERAYVSFRSFNKPEVLSQGHINPIKALSFYIRRKLLSSVKKILPKPYSDLLSGILFGKAAASVPEEIREQFKKTGTVHILVVSGMHLSILIGTILVILKSFRLPLWISVVIASVFNLLYVLAAGSGASVIRAGIMAQAAMLGQVFERDRDFLTALSLAALILLIINPLSLFQIGFQLSFTATISLVYLAPLIADKIPLQKFWASLISISIAPMLMTAPIILYNFNQISFVTVFANFMIIPWIGYLVILGFAGALLGVFFLPLGQILGGSLFLMLKVLHGIVAFFSSLPFAYMFFSSPHFLLIVLYYLAIGLLIYRFRIGKLVCVVVLILFVFSAAFAPASQLLEMTVLDVGQGDAIFIQTPTGKRVLIDGSESFKRSDMGKKIIIPFLHRRGINKLDLVVLTHPHDDHVGGLPSVLAGIKVDMVLDSGQVHASRKYIEFLELVKKKNIKYIVARAGQIINLGPRVLAQVLSPSEPLIEESALNNNSVVLRLVYQDVSFLLMGDSEREAEERILCGEPFHGMAVRSNILKVGHHGSSSSSSAEFLEMISPQVAVISCGKDNKFRHPHKSVLERLESRGIKVYRTDINGAVTIKSDGKKIFIKTQEGLIK